MKYERMAREQEQSQSQVQAATSFPPVVSTVPATSDRMTREIQHAPASKPPATSHAQRNDAVETPSTAGTQASSAKGSQVDASDTYNGDVADRYSWAQTTTDVDVKVSLPAGVKASQIKVSFQPKHLRATVNTGGEESTLLEGELSERIRPSECMWSKDGDRLQLSLEKHNDFMWKSVFIGGKEIDLNKIDNTRQLSDYDDDVQSGVRKAMYDQEQRMKGLPTSDEQKTLGTLQKAWDAEGSPFKGTPFDPSVLNLSGSNLGGMPPDLNPS